jgi:hypothetical protein
MMAGEALHTRFRRALRLIACAGVLLALAGRVEAQQTDDFGIWLGGSANGKLPPSWNNAQGSWRFWMDVQLRFGDDASQLSQAVLRPGIGYALGRGWTVWGGYAYIRTDPPYSSSSTTENRIWEQASWSARISGTAWSSRTRLEQRFMSTGNETGWRLRQLVKLARPVTSGKAWSAVVSDEYFLNLNSTDFGATAGADRNRLFVGPGVVLDKALSMEIGYLNQHIFRSNGPDKTDHVLATNLSWSF